MRPRQTGRLVQDLHIGESAADIDGDAYRGVRDNCVGGHRSSHRHGQAAVDGQADR